MSEKIEPALTAEEWKSPADALDGYLDLAGGVVDVRLGGAHGGGDLVGDAAKLIAFLNAALPDSDPRKITREKIAALRSAAGTSREYDSGGQAVQRDATVLEAFADALESLLPLEPQ